MSHCAANDWKLSYTYVASIIGSVAPPRVCTSLAVVVIFFFLAVLRSWVTALYVSFVSFIAHIRHSNHARGAWKYFASICKGITVQELQIERGGVSSRHNRGIDRTDGSEDADGRSNSTKLCQWLPALWRLNRTFEVDLPEIRSIHRSYQRSDLLISDPLITAYGSLIVLVNYTRARVQFQSSISELDKTIGTVSRKFMPIFN